MRNLIVMAKVCLGVDRTVDAIIARLSSVRDLSELVTTAQSGRGLLYWASYYDPWLMGDDLSPRNLNLHTEPIAEGLWKSAWPKKRGRTSNKESRNATNGTNGIGLFGTYGKLSTHSAMPIPTHAYSSVGKSWAPASMMTR